MNTTLRGTYGPLISKRASILTNGSTELKKSDYEGIPPLESLRSQVKHESVLYYDDDDTKDDEEKKIRKPSSKKIMSNVSKTMMFLFV